MELGRNPIISNHQIQLEYGDEHAEALKQDRTAEPVSRDQVLRRERGQRNIHFPCSADHKKRDWQPYPVDPYSCYYTVCILRAFVLQMPRRFFSGVTFVFFASFFVSMLSLKPRPFVQSSFDMQAFR